MTFSTSNRLFFFISLICSIDWSRLFVMTAVIDVDGTSRMWPPTVARPSIYGERAFPCRLSEEDSLCVDPPFDTYNDSLWCKTRMCGSSYVLAEPCSVDESEKPDSLCAPLEQSREIVKCKAGYKPMEQYLPF